MTPEFSAEARDIIDGMQTSFVERFRSFYREDRLRDAGRTTFAGRPAQRYVVERPDGSSSEYFIDAETALPLGRVQDGRGARLTERVTVLETLRPSPQNLAKVRAGAGG